MKPNTPISGKVCSVCGASLDVHQAASGRICGRQRCLVQHARSAADSQAARRRRDEDHTRGRAMKTARGLIETGKIGRYGQYHAAEVPAMNRRSGRSDDNRRNQYLQHLDELLAQWGRRATAAPPEPGQSESSHAVEALSAEACATCRGLCCTRGGTHAFQTVETIRSWFRRNPNASSNECRRAYQAALPTHSIEGSCVFHGPRGCSLPRTDRAGWCNQFKCPSLLLLERLQRLAPRPTMIVLAVASEKTQRIRVVDSGSGKPLEKEVEING